MQARKTQSVGRGKFLTMSGPDIIIISHMPARRTVRCIAAGDLRLDRSTVSSDLNG